jgi:hypothetical protein
MKSTGTTSPTTWGSCVHPHIYSLVHMCTNVLTIHLYRWLLLLHEMFNGREVLCAEYNKDQNVTHCGYIWVQKKQLIVYVSVHFLLTV